MFVYQRELLDYFYTIETLLLINITIWTDFTFFAFFVAFSSISKVK
jgi:hypothetical protein